MNSLPHEKADKANTGFQYLEDLSTGYWYSETLFAAVELEIFDRIQKGFTTIGALASDMSCEPETLKRLLTVLESLALLINEGEMWFNSQTVSKYLVSDSSEYLGDFILYRKYMKTQWQDLVYKVVPGNEPLKLNGNDIHGRFFNYLQSTDSLIKLKKSEIAEKLNMYEWDFPVLDIGGGAGSLLREVVKSKKEKTQGESQDKAILFDLADVIEAAEILYPDKKEWDSIETIEGDFRKYNFSGMEKFGLIIMSNFLHAYGAAEARSLLNKACTMLKPDGIILIHDYFPDRMARFPQKGKLYDLNMMINTYNGRCHKSSEITDWLKSFRLDSSRIFDLDSDTSVIIAHGKDRKPADVFDDKYGDICSTAFGLGFLRAVPLPVSDIVTASWPRLKCRFGCEKYNTNLKCPPFGLEHDQTEKLLKEYSYAVLLEGAPPGKDFHKRLLELEKQTFLNGCHKALVFIAGPCSLCESCPEDGNCRNPKMARPSMEGSGIDVYATCEKAGIPISPVKQKNEYVKYIGMLLMD